MKYASQRWMGAVAVCLGGWATPAWANPPLFPDEAPVFADEDMEASVSLRPQSQPGVSFSDAAGSVRMGASPSGSVTTEPIRRTQHEEVPQLSPMTQAEVMRPTAPVFQEAMVPADTGVGYAQTRNLNQILWRLGRVNMDQFGFNGGYTNFNGFVPLFSGNGESLIFINPRIGVTDYGMAVANIGAGVRTYSPSRNRVYGASFWYDYDDGHSTSFNQLGGSFESIGQYVSFRGNVYIPVGDRKSLAGFTDGAQSFTENYITVQRNYLFDNTYQVYETEASVPMPVLGKYGFDMGAGVYYLNGDDVKDSAGVSGRIQAQVTENFWMNGTYTYDDVFESNFSLNFEFTMPDGAPRRWFRRPSVSSHLTQSVQRRYRVAVGRQSISGNVRGEDQNGNDITIVYIDPNAPAGGDGTIENPYQSTDEYAADPNANRYQFIYVRQGTDENMADFLNSGITMVEYIPQEPGDSGIPAYGQKLIGEIGMAAEDRPFYDVFFDGVYSRFQLPNDLGLTDGSTPILSNYTGGGDPVVTIASGNGHEIYGLTINGATSVDDLTPHASGIVTLGTTDGFLIHRNTFQNVINGIQINSDTSVATGLTFDDYGRIINNTFTGTVGESIQAVNINHTNGGMNLLVADNTISDFQNGATSGGIFVSSTGAGSTINGVTAIDPVTNLPIAPELGIVRNTVTNSGSGIVLSADNGTTFQTDLSNNTVTGSTEATGNGLQATATAGSSMVFNNFNNNVFNTGAGNGASLSATGASEVLVLQNMLANQFNNNGVDGLNVVADNSQVLIQGIGDGTQENGNQFNGNLDDGLDATVTAGGEFSVVNPVMFNQFNSNGDNGLIASATGANSRVGMILGDPTTGSVIGNQFNSNGAQSGSGSGINFSATNGAILDTAILNNSVASNRANGIVYNYTNAATEDQIFIQGNNVLANGLNALSINTDTTDIAQIYVDNNILSGSLNGDGFDFNALGSTIGTGDEDGLLLTNNGIQNNIGNGVDINLDGSTATNVLIQGNRGGQALAGGTLGFEFNNLIWTTTMANTSTAGLDIAHVILDSAPSGQVWRPDLTPFTTGEFQPDNGSDLTTGLTTVNGNTVIAGTTPLQGTNGQPLAGGGVAVGSTILDLIFNDFNPGEQFDYSLAHSLPGNDTIQSGTALAGSTATVILADGRSAAGVLDANGLTISQNMEATFNGISSNTLDGIRMNVDNGSAVNRLIIDDNNVEANGQNGINLIVANGSTMPAAATPAVITNNSINANGANGVLLNVNTGTELNVQSVLNTITNNTGNGILSTVGPGSTVRLNVQADQILNNTLAGVNADLTGDGRYEFDMVGSRVEGNQQYGVFINALGTSTYEANIGSLNDASNLITNNVDVGVGVFSDNGASGTLNVRNTTVSNTTSSGTPGSLFNGEGISAVLRGSSRINGSVQASDVNGSAGSGIRMTTTGNNQGSFSEIESFLIGGPTADLSNRIANNGVHGIEFLRTSNGAIGTVSPVTIQLNQIENNTVDGINLSARNALQTDAYVIDQNNIVNNGQDGIHLDVQADATLDADITANLIDGNAANGILTTEIANFPSDARSVTGSWQRNTITNNTLNGISLTSVTGGPNFGFPDSPIDYVNSTYVPSTADMLEIGSETDPTQGNLIANNGLDGIDITGATSVAIGHNEIRDNALHGIDIGGVATKDIRITTNMIRNNGYGANAGDELGDGIEFQNNTNGGYMRLFVLGNDISFNAGRGVDILNQFNAWSQVLIGQDTFGNGNIVNANGGEGIYVVNTSSTSQTQNGPTPYNQSDASKGMNADGAINRNPFLQITIDDTLVVGNGFNTDFRATGIVMRVGTTGGGYGFTNPGGFASISNGGVLAQMSNNILGGNFGDDILIESFTSTVDPSTTQGTWNQNEFTITGNSYQGDPLARLDLAYRNNTIEAASVTVTGAYYDNAEGTFKSRLNNIQAPNIPGPFASATRYRNAQRQQIRTYPGGQTLPPGGGPGGSFMYPGMGDSTFRIDTANSDDFATLLLTGFIFDDNSPVQSSADLNGVFYPVNIPQTPWGWGAF